LPLQLICHLPLCLLRSLLLGILLCSLWQLWLLLLMQQLLLIFLLSMQHCSRLIGVSVRLWLGCGKGRLQLCMLLPISRRMRRRAKGISGGGCQGVDRGGLGV